ncbi:MAG: phospholipid carrier-dependent glycosyltransferase [Thermoproteota archaeon]
MSEHLMRAVLLLKSLTVIFIFISLFFYLFSIPIGIMLFTAEAFSNGSASLEIQNLIKYLFFTLAEATYVLCFVLAWKSGESLRKSLYNFLHKTNQILPENFLLLMPIVLSLAYVTLGVVESIQKYFQIPTGFPPLSSDPLSAYLELAWSPIVEELVYRALPLGIFYTFYLNGEVKSSSTYRRLVIALLSFFSPKRAKNFLEVETLSKFQRKIEFDEWVIIVFSSGVFALSHYLAPGSWNVGKLSIAFFQGFFMAISYVFYGLYASILLHWYFNYYLYTSKMVMVFQPRLSFLSLLNEVILTILAALVLLISIKNINMTSLFIPCKDFQQFFRKLKYKIVKTFKNMLHFRISRKTIPELILLILVTLTLGLRLAILEYPKSFVFDEEYYVSAARDLLRGKATNNEHPPLAKMLIALGIILLGDNPIGWRIFTVFASSISVVLIYILALYLSDRKDISLLSATLFAFDIMAFNVGQIAILDAPAMLFTLAAVILILKERYDLSGIFLGLASLCKLDSVFVYLGTVAFLYLSKRYLNKSFKELAKSCLRSLVTAFVIFLLVLWFYDAWYSIFMKNPLTHISYMLIYHSSLKYQESKNVILPLQWINPIDPFTPIPFYVMTIKEVVGGILKEYSPIAYYEIYTPVWWSIWIVVPLSLFQIIREFRREQNYEKIYFFTLTWIFSSFLPYVFMAYVLSRWVYPFYFFLTLPGLYIGLSHHLNQIKYSKLFRTLVIFLQVFWFILWFPVKPKILIDFLYLLNSLFNQYFNL